MKKKDFIIAATLLVIIAAAIYLGTFWGGLVAGALAVHLVYTTLGKIVWLRTAKKVDAATQALIKINSLMPKSGEL